MTGKQRKAVVARGAASRKSIQTTKRTTAMPGRNLSALAKKPFAGALRETTASTGRDPSFEFATARSAFIHNRVISYTSKRHKIVADF
jgi:hypothetical protein